jgi:DNA-3-methyladenine glycosylase
MTKLPRKFYNQPTLKVAKLLLGKFLVRKIGKRKVVGKIVETEAYVGPKDLASHASRGKTPRTEVMFGPPGHAYVYLIYGLNYCFNIVTERKDYPAAVLIRAVEPIEGIDLMCQHRKSIKRKKSIFNFSFLTFNLTNGPGKLCQAFKIDKKLNNADLTGNILWVEDRGIKISPKDIVATKRIGVDYAKEYKDKPWRFYIKGNKFVSKK